MKRRIFYRYKKAKPITGKALTQLRNINVELNQLTELLAHIQKRITQGWRHYEGQNIFSLSKEMTAEIARLTRERNKILRDRATDKVAAEP